MSCFEDALCCCCPTEEGKEFAKPDMHRYSTPIQWTNYPMDLYGAVDFNYEEREDGVHVEESISPLVPMPDSMEYLSTRYFIEPPDCSPQASDLGKCKDKSNE